MKKFLLAIAASLAVAGFIFAQGAGGPGVGGTDSGITSAVTNGLQGAGQAVLKAGNSSGAQAVDGNLILTNANFLVLQNAGNYVHQMGSIGATNIWKFYSKPDGNAGPNDNGNILSFYDNGGTLAGTIGTAGSGLPGLVMRGGTAGSGQPKMTLADDSNIGFNISMGGGGGAIFQIVTNIMYFDSPVIYTGTYFQYGTSGTPYLSRMGTNYSVTVPALLTLTTFQTNVVCTGAIAGNTVSVGMKPFTSGLFCQGNSYTNNQVTLQYVNPTAGTITPAVTVTKITVDNQN